MIQLGKALESGRAKNIKWLQSKAEVAKLDGEFDLVTFASSISLDGPSSPELGDD